MVARFLSREVWTVEFHSSQNTYFFCFTWFYKCLLHPLSVNMQLSLWVSYSHSKRQIYLSSISISCHHVLWAVLETVGLFPDSVPSTLSEVACIEECISPLPACSTESCDAICVLLARSRQLLNVPPSATSGGVVIRKRVPIQ